MCKFADIFVLNTSQLTNKCTLTSIRRQMMFDLAFGRILVELAYNFQGLGELLALNMCYFVINLLFVMVSRYI